MPKGLIDPVEWSNIKCSISINNIINERIVHNEKSILCLISFVASDSQLRDHRFNVTA